ncbi:MAG: hypothetical protein J6B59_06950 [Alistipes sp.]|nr:hypothetical protein [Alistipes sp.]
MMGLFSPYKRHANRFNYIPRFYDPEKERREQRRAELRGERSDSEQGEYTPGQYICTQREARAARRSDEREQRNRSVWKMVVGAALMLLLIAILFPRLVDAFQRAQRQPATQSVEWQARQTTDAFDQSGISDVEWQAQPITVVPNDYTE